MNFEYVTLNIGDLSGEIISSYSDYRFLYAKLLKIQNENDEILRIKSLI